LGEPDEPEDCYICDRPTGPGDFCPGCREWICGECDAVRPPEPHDPNDHRHYAGD
jgi:hypothetical protein